VTNSLKQFRANLGKVFDDNLDTRQWYNIIDWVIVIMILLSSVEIFLATFSWPEPFSKVLSVINDVTLWFFVVEVSLRIWAAPEKSPRYNGFWGRVRYCFTFYGFIDLISTYPFLIQYFVPLPLPSLKVLRVARIIRIFRITRYAKSFSLLSNSIREKRNELIVSMQFLLIITFILSLILFYYEHEAQPDVYNDGFVSVVWAFAQYIGDPGQFADTPPVTFVGKAIACIIGLLGIAIVAVPAGILGSGFTETIERETKKKEVAENAQRLRMAFQRKLDRLTGFQTVPPLLPVATLQAKLSMTEDDIVNAVNSDEAPFFRLVNTATTIPMGETAADRLAVVHFTLNRPYGTLIDRGSTITIIDTSAYCDAGVGNWSFYLALIGGFNYISRETGNLAELSSFFNQASDSDNLDDFNADLRTLLSRQGAWGICVLVSSGALEPNYPTDLHLQIGGKKGDTRTGGDDLFVRDEQRYRNFYAALEETLAEQFSLSVDHQKFHDTSGKNIIFRKLQLQNPGNIIMRVRWHCLLWDPRRILLAREIATVINATLRPTPSSNPDNPELRTKRIAFDGYE